MKHLSEFILKDHDICITHGNGPQVGNELISMDLTNVLVPPLHLGLSAANTQGQIGYMVQQTIQNILRDLEVDR